jgi:hypothetical protein
VVEVLRRAEAGLRLAKSAGGGQVYG